MANDITRVDAAQPVEITDGQSQTVMVRTSTPSSSDEGLVVREVARGQEAASDSIPVVLATDQSPLSVTSNFEYIEDTLHANGDTGVFVLAVRNDAGTALAGDGDYSPLQVNSTGALRVNSPNKVDDSAFTIATDSVSPMGALADEAATDSVDEGDVGLVRMTLTRILKTKLIGDFGGVDVPLAVDPSGNLAISAASLGGKIDDTIFNTTTDGVLPIGFIYQTSGGSVDDGDIGIARMTEDRIILARLAGNDDNLVDVDHFGNLKAAIGDSSILDAFGRMRASFPTNTFEVKFDQTDQGLLTTTSTATGGTVTRNSAQSNMELVITTSTGSTAILQSKQYLPYQPGRSQQILMTGLMGDIKTGVRQRIGYFDANNGLFFEQDGTNLKVVQRTATSGSPVDTAVNQSSWNIDPLDGTGPSGYTIDTGSTNIFTIDFEWLGVGRVRMGLVIDGKFVYCHEFNNANSGQTVPYMQTGSLPLRWEISATGSPASSTTLKAICGCVMSESGFNPKGIARSVDTGSGSAKSVGSTEQPLISIRLKSANARALIEVIRSQVIVLNPDDIRWRMHLNPTLSGASWTSVGTNSITEFDISATSISAAGTILQSGFLTEDQVIFDDISDILRLASNFAGTADILTLSAQNLGGGSANIRAAIYFRELF